MMLFLYFLCSMNLYLTLYVFPIFMFKRHTLTNVIKNKILINLENKQRTRIFFLGGRIETEGMAGYSTNKKINHKQHIRLDIKHSKFEN